MPYSPQVIKILEDNQRDMRLQAAAPDLLEALKSFVKWTEIHKLNHAQLINGKYAEVPVVINARKAIAKAEATED